MGALLEGALVPLARSAAQHATPLVRVRARVGVRVRVRVRVGLGSPQPAGDEHEGASVELLDADLPSQSVRQSVSRTDRQPASQSASRPNSQPPHSVVLGQSPHS